MSPWHVFVPMAIFEIAQVVALQPLRLLVVGMTRFELATPRPPDAYSNRTELHPEHANSKKALPRGGVFSKSDAKLILLFEMCKLFWFFLQFFFLQSTRSVYEVSRQPKA